MVSRTVVIEDKYGVHMTPAMRICEEAQKYNAICSLQVGNAHVNLKSILNVLAARIKKGCEVTVVCDGEEENQALEALCEILKPEHGEVPTGIVGKE